MKNPITTNEETIIINKKQAIANFFYAYSHDIDGSICTKTKDELQEYLYSDIFIGMASSVTGIAEHEFIDFAIAYYGE